MKLGALNTAIRTLTGPPRTNGRYLDANGTVIELKELEVSKQSLLAALKEQFPDGKTAETYLRLDASGHIVPEGKVNEIPTMHAAASRSSRIHDTIDVRDEDAETDLDGLLG